MGKIASIIFACILAGIAYASWPSGVLDAPLASLTIRKAGLFLISCITGISAVCSLFRGLFED
jgi:hypothetical protein